MIPLFIGQMVTFTAPAQLSPGQIINVPLPHQSLQSQPAQLQVPTQSEPETIVVRVPPGVQSGMQMMVQAPNGQKFPVVVPPGVGPGQAVRVPLPSGTVSTSGSASSGQLSGVPPEGKRQQRGFRVW